MRTKLKEEENLIIEVRKHWIVLLKPIVAIACILFILPNLNKYNPSGFKDILFKASLYGLAACILYLVYVYLDRRYDIWAVTNQRVIDESGIITHRAKESPLEKINNIDIVQTLMGRLMGYGRVQIQTAATEGESWINFVEKPVALQDAIIRERENLRKRENLKEREDMEKRKNLAGGETPARDTIKEPPKIQEIRECPFCAETILKKAKICRFCGRELPKEELPGGGVSAKEPLTREILTEKTFAEKPLIEKPLAEKTLTKKAPIVETTEAGLTSEKTPIADTPQAENAKAENAKAKEALSYHNPHLWKRIAKQKIETTENEENEENEEKTENTEIGEYRE